MEYRVIGLTGGIATGKSTISGFLVKLGFYVIDADVIARMVIAPGSDCLKKIIECFGIEYVRNDGTLNRSKLGKRVFSNVEELKKLNQITKSALLAEFKLQIDTAKNQVLRYPVIFFDCALLLEDPDYEALVDEVWVVHIEEKTQLTRLMNRNGYTRIEAQQRIDSQMKEEQRLQKADYIINNENSLETTLEQLLQIIEIRFLNDY